jgi:hypothetical protein
MTTTRTVTLTYNPTTRESTINASWYRRPITCPEPLGLEGVENAVKVWEFAGVDVTLVIAGADQ